MKHDLKRGALLLASATFFTAALNALQKLTGSTLPALEIIFFRNLFSLPFVLLIASRTAIILKTHHFFGHVLRSVVGLISMIMIVITVTRLPLAEQQVLSYTQPLFLVLLSIPLLHERPSLQRWVAVSIGFSGVIVVALGKGLLHGHDMTGSAVPIWAYFVALAQGGVGALTTMQIRQLSATESSTTISLWQAILMTVMTALPLPFIWTTPSLTEAGCLVAVGAFAGIAQVLQTEAFASAQVSAIGPFAYSGLLWAALIGWFGFGEMPGIAMCIGGLLIIGSGVWMLRHDRPAKQKAVAEGTMDAATGTPP
ncbi:DMT family transporter [Novacetimonas hansenii]|uniref:DMT family transporter n=1 Tax=Novacetimonas hansenii TaxID=436 RepID=UPI000789AFC4|nr:DMT family transporter [Novacetimonas hansenii]RFP01157.1 multidrug transporter [Novacetimonas hansenii]WEQ59469.1 DMT family transporter [Novacetimonas hansenii]CUW46892.1 Riboflavin transporter [Novacetimonas hansenii]